MKNARKLCPALGTHLSRRIELRERTALGAMPLGCSAAGYLSWSREGNSRAALRQAQSSASIVSYSASSRNAVSYSASARTLGHMLLAIIWKWCVNMLSAIGRHWCIQELMGAAGVET